MKNRELFPNDPPLVEAKGPMFVDKFTRLQLTAQEIGKQVARGEIKCPDGRSVEAVAKAAIRFFFDGLDPEKRAAIGEIARDGFIREKWRMQNGE